MSRRPTRSPAAGLSSIGGRWIAVVLLALAAASPPAVLAQDAPAAGALEAVTGDPPAEAPEGAEAAPADADLVPLESTLSELERQILEKLKARADAELRARDPAPEASTATGAEDGVGLRDIHRVAYEVWNLTLFSSGGSEVKLNQIVIAVVIVLLGILVSRTVSGVLRKRLAKLKRLDDHAAVVIQKVAFYLLLVVIVLLAMQVVGIPITVFTVLGGALAIGVGFGAQNIFNNLISGFIIVLEKPIRVGDIIELNETEGRVAAIGNRATRVRRFDGIDVLLPNAHFLEQQVVNWTLHDTEIRGKVSVGVAYGSDTAAVRDIIEQAARDSEAEGVLAQRKIEVIFEEFGDNALAFDLYFWTRVTTPMDLKRVRSAIRYRIDELCNDRGVVIAFPQRDVHLDTARPLEVRLSREEDREDS